MHAFGVRVDPVKDQANKQPTCPPGRGGAGSAPAKSTGGPRPSTTTTPSFYLFVQISVRGDSWTQGVRVLLHFFSSMSGKNRWLVTDEPVEFEK